MSLIRLCECSVHELADVEKKRMIREEWARMSEKMMRFLASTAANNTTLSQTDGMHKWTLGRFYDEVRGPISHVNSFPLKTSRFRFDKNSAPSNRSR